MTVRSGVYSSPGTTSKRTVSISYPARPGSLIACFKIGVTEYGCLDAPDDPLSCAIAAAEYKQATIISNRDKIISAPAS